MNFSIVIPTYNESAIIKQSVQCILDSSFKDFEVIVVDDSTDNTAEIVNNFKSEKIRLIKPQKRLGRSEARNLGIKLAKNEVVVILNADVLMPPDFLEKITFHYKNGYESVTVFVRVKNTDKVYARFIELWTQYERHRGEYERRKTANKGLYWSEGFSVRRDVLVKTNLFPSGYSVPIVAGEDVKLADELRKMGCKGMIDTSITISHVAPETFGEFWSVRVGRGKGSAQIKHFIQGWSLKKIFGFTIFKASYKILKIVTVVPTLLLSFRLAKHSPKNFIIEICKMFYVRVLEEASFSVGEIVGLYEIAKANQPK